jgi:hypothetical protein
VTSDPREALQRHLERWMLQHKITANEYQWASTLLAATPSAPLDAPWSDANGDEIERGEPDHPDPREALRRIVVRAQGQSLSGVRVRPEAALTAIREEAEAALAATPSASLDVERLARALRLVGMPAPDAADYLEASSGQPMNFHAFAAAIAAAYASEEAAR